MLIKQLQLGDMLNFVYLIGDESTGIGAVIDPAWEIEEVIKTVKDNNINITAALITHCHFDHCNGLDKLTGHFPGLDVYIQKEEAGFARDPGSGRSITGKIEGKSRNVKILDGKTEFNLGTLKVLAIPTPGHSPGSQSFLIDNCLFTGDTLFINGCGRTDIPGSDTETLYKSMAEIKSLPPQTIIYPGHDYGNMPHITLAEELKHNPYLSASSLEAFLKLVR